MTDPTIAEFQRRRAAAQGNLIPLDALTEVPAELRDLTAELGGVIGTVNLIEIATPSNAAIQEANFKEEFAGGRVYEPNFRYPLAEQTDTVPMRDQLRGLKTSAAAVMPKPGSRATVWFQRTLLDLIDDALLTADAIDGMAGRGLGTTRGNKLANQAYQDKYWALDAKLLHDAHADLDMRCVPATLVTGKNGLLSDEQKDRLKGMTFNAAGTVKVLEWALGRCGLLRQRGQAGAGFAVIVTDQAKALDVRHRSSEGAAVFVPDDSVSGPRDNARDMICIVAEHEIRGHAQNAANGWKLFGICGGEVTGDDETLYEGVAMGYEDASLAALFGKQEATWPFPFVYPLAIECALEGGSFHDVAEATLDQYLRSMMKVPKPGRVTLTDLRTEEEREDAIHAAWRTAYRVKRGLRSTNANSGCFPKDLAYARGAGIQAGLEDLGLGHLTRALVVHGKEGLLSLADWDIPEAALPYNTPSFAYELAEVLLNGTLLGH